MSRGAEPQSGLKVHILGGGGGGQEYYGQHLCASIQLVKQCSSHPWVFAKRLCSSPFILPSVTRVGPNGSVLVVCLTQVRFPGRGLWLYHGEFKANT